MQKIINKYSVIPALICTLLISIGTALAADFDRITLQVGEKNLDVEYANNFEQRAQGLMNRKSMCEDCGMLFRYSKPRIASMWMKNTFIPLDIAFIKADGTIADIVTMKPHDLTSIRSSEAVLYALEMNQGWFSKNSIGKGQIVKISTNTAL